MQTPRRLIIVSVLSVVAAVPLLGQGVALKYTWPKGEELRYEFKTEINSTITGLPGIGDMTSDTSTVQVHQMVGDGVTSDGLATVRLRIESVKMTMTSPMMSMTYDSATAAPTDPMSAQLATIYAPLIGAALTATMAPNGSVKSLEGMAKIKAAAPPAAQQAIAALGVTGGGDPMSDEAMKATYQVFASLPDKAIKTGDTWNTEVTSPNPMGAQTISNSFTAKGVEQLDGHDVFRIGVVQTIKTAPGGTMGPMSVVVGEGAGQGDVLFNAKLGRLERCTIDMTLPMTMSMTAPDGTSMSFQSSSKAKTTIQLVKK